MDMDSAPNPNPLDIRITMDIHGFTHYVQRHSNTRAFQQCFGSIYVAFRQYQQ
jgi:hypothetical protein